MSKWLKRLLITAVILGGAYYALVMHSPTEGTAYTLDIAKVRELANAMPGDFLAVCSAGAYGFVQSSNYNSRPRAPEVLVDGATWRTIRHRETLEDLVRGETV